MILVLNFIWLSVVYGACSGSTCESCIAGSNSGAWISCMWCSGTSSCYNFYDNGNSCSGMPTTICSTGNPPPYYYYSPPPYNPPNVFAIVGGVFGGIFVLVVTIVIVMIFCRAGRFSRFRTAIIPVLVINETYEVNITSGGSKDQPGTSCPPDQSGSGPSQGQPPVTSCPPGQSVSYPSQGQPDMPPQYYTPQAGQPGMPVQYYNPQAGQPGQYPQGEYFFPHPTQTYAPAAQTVYPKGS